MYNLEDIKKVLPHRDPFLFLDEVTHMCHEEKTITARKTFHADLDIFKGHFPGKPITPGVIILESMAQAGAFLVLSYEGYQGKIAFFAGADNVKWRNPVLPGDTIEIKVDVVNFRHGVGVSKGVASVNGVVVCEATLKVVVR